MSEKQKSIYVFHPFLFAIYLILGSYSQNSTQVPINWVVRPLLFLLLVSIIVYFGLKLIFKDAEYAGFVSTLFMNWIFMGHIYRVLLDGSSFWRTPVGGMMALLIVSVPLVLLGSRWLWKKISYPRLITVFLNSTSAILILFPVWTTAGILYKGDNQIQHVREEQERFQVSLNSPSTVSPDIYLIIVDGYGRADILQDLYGYDNTQLMEFLKTKGFYVADRATSNYPQTQLSLPSMLNLQYVNDVTRDFGESADRSALYELLQRPLIRTLLEQEGYQFVALPSATLITQMRNADIYLYLDRSRLTEFEGFLLSTSVVGVIGDSWGMELPVMGYDLHSRYTLFALEKLRDVPALPGPKFVFAHIMLPHPPFLFDKDGNYTIPDRPYMMGDGSFFPGTIAEYQKGYSEQTTFLNGELEDIINTIIARSAVPPVIIVQGDHGPGSYFNLEGMENPCLKERYSILNAYYFPDGNYSRLYPSITPINTFRVILNQYFGADLKLLDDRNYYSTWSAPYVFTDVTDEAQTCTVNTKKND